MNDIVEIICYGRHEKMERQKAIKEYKMAILCSEGHERNRYVNILMDLEMGYKVCNDRDGDY